MNRIDHLAERSNESPQPVLGLLISLPQLILLTLIMLIDATNTMHAFTQPPMKVSGKLKDISAGYLSGVGLHVNGNLYLVQKVSFDIMLDLPSMI